MQPAVDEIEDGIYRIATLVPEVGPDGFTFNQFLIAAEEPLLFHTGPRGMFSLVAEAVATVLPVERLRWITFGHMEADECGSVNMWLAAAPTAGSLFHASSLAPRTATTLRALGELRPGTLAIMHGSSFAGDGKAALDLLADRYDELVGTRC